LLHLVGFLSSRFTHDARSQEHKVLHLLKDEAARLAQLPDRTFREEKMFFPCEEKTKYDNRPGDMGSKWKHIIPQLFQKQRAQFDHRSYSDGANRRPGLRRLQQHLR